jgi:hypothetical protein
MTASMEAARQRTPGAGGHRPGYLVVRGGGETAYLGALMVTDHTGLPLDFRYTDPITPTRLQRALYGGVLDRHLRTEVVARTLVGAVTQAPTLIIVDERGLADEQVAGCPVVVLGASAAGPLGAVGSVHSQGGDSLLLQVAEGVNPVRVGVGAEDPSPGRDAATRALVELGATMDLLEPLERVRAALDLIAAGEIAPDEE